MVSIKLPASSTCEGCKAVFAVRKAIKVLIPQVASFKCFVLYGAKTRLRRSS